MSPAFARRQQFGPFDWVVAALHALNQRPVVHAVSACDLRDRLSGYCADVATCVVRLRARRGPSAIAGFVMPIRVDAVEGPAVRARSHVFIEGDEVIHPRTAHSDAAPTIPRIVVILLVIAARACAIPRLIFATVIALADCLQVATASTPATLRVIPQQIVRRHGHSAPAVTLTGPPYAPRCGGAMSHHERSESLSRQIAKE